MKQGFTLFEMMVVIAIIMIIGVVIYLNVNSSQKETSLSGARQQIVSALREAESNAMSQAGGLNWGVRFDNRNQSSPVFTLFTTTSTTSFTSSSVVSGTYPLPSGICYTNPDVGSVIDVVFSQINGQLSGQYQLITLKVCNGSGSILNWSTQNPLPQPDGGSTVVYGNYVYIVGGYGNGSYNTVYYAHINPNGTLGNWMTASSLPSTIYVQGVAASGGYLYSMGGYIANSYNDYTADVNFAKINNDGSLGPWTTTTPLPAVAYANDGIAANGYVYSVGGQSAWSTYLNQVFYAKPNADGTIGSWSTSPLPYGRSQGPAVAVGNYLYIVGGLSGWGATSSVWFAPFNADGSLGTWVQTSPLPSYIIGQAAAANGGYIYSMGGYTPSGIVPDVNYAKINIDGTLGSWSAGTPLPRQNYVASGVNYNGYIFFIGGRDQALNYQTTVYSVPLVNFLSPNVITITPQGLVN